MFSVLHDVCYARLGCPDLEEMVTFSTRILGLELYDRGDDWAFLRADNRTHNICYFQGEVTDETAGFETGSAGELAELKSLLEERGIKVISGSEQECQARRVQAFIAFSDPSGTELEVCYGTERTGRGFFPSRDINITEFGHFGLHANKLKESLEFWTGILGARISDQIGPAPLLRIDEVHHKVALFPSQKSGIQHINFQVGSIDDIMQSWYLLQENGVPIVFGPGRHPTSTGIFLYFRGPDGRVYEYSHGVKKILDEDTYVPRFFEFEPASFCMWGAKPQIDEFSD